MALLILGLFPGQGNSQGQSITSINNSSDSVLVFPAYITESAAAGIQYKIPDIPLAERQWHVAKGQHNRQAELKAMLHLSDAYLAHGKDLSAYQQLTKYLDLIDLADDFGKAHFYYSLSVIFSHLGNYPIAMACFQRTGDIVPQFGFKKKHNRYKVADTLFHFNDQVKDSYQDNQDRFLQTGIFSNKGLYEILRGLDATQVSGLNQETDAEPVDVDSVVANFEDGKKAVAYALVLHTKQPVSGKKKVFTSLSNVGHMFVTLIKYNLDETVVSQTLGLYPQPGFLVSANPLFPKTDPLFKNDAGHTWDEMLGKFLDESTFNHLLDYLSANADKPYHLNSNNCSDFALSLASIAGIDIENTVGSWPLGHGRNPGCTGQSILSGKFSNKETGGHKGLLAVTNHLFVK